MKFTILCAAFIVCSASQLRAQLVATYYSFSQSNGTYTPLVAAANTTPANIYTSSWDDLAYTGYTLPFAFTYNGTLYPAGTVIGLDTDAWFAFNPGSMTGQLTGGSWVSATNSTGAYLYGTANNNGFAGFNADVHNQNFTVIQGTLTTGNVRIQNVNDGTEKGDLRIGTRLIGTGIPDGAVVTNLAPGNNYIDMSMPATTTTANNGASITPAASIFAMTRGTAPNRQFVVQWTQVRRYSGPDNDNFSFQMILNEAGGNTQLQTLQVVYGACTTAANTGNSLNIQVGLRGASAADFNARQSAAGWATSTAATANNQHVVLHSGSLPASGLTFTWSPCAAAPSNAGSITGVASICPGSSANYSLTAVSGATGYTWAYSGTGVTMPATTTLPNNTLVFSPTATGGILTVTPTNFCGNGNVSPGYNIAVTAVTPASVSYAAPSYCSSQPPVSVSLSGPTGGTYSASPAGLSINNSTGQVTPATSAAGTYTINYSYSSNGCDLSAQTTVIIKPVVAVTATAAPASMCGSGSTQLQATASPSGYSVSPITYSLLNPSSTATTIWNTDVDDAVSGAIPIPFAFSFYGQNITQLFACTNGYIQLGASTGSDLTPQTLPDVTTPNNIIAMVWDDLEIDLTVLPGAYVRYFVNGTAPNRVMVIDYNRLLFFGGTAAAEVSGQIRLYESDSHIEVAIAKANDEGDFEFKTLGIENATGTEGLSPIGRNNLDWDLAAPEAWTFNQTIYNYLWSPATNLSNAAIANPTASGLTANSSYSVLVTDNASGCSGTTSVNITVNNPQVSNPVPGERCGSGTVNLAATGSNLNWYTTASGGTAVGSGNTFTTPVLTTTTNYWVCASTGGSTTVTLGAGALTATHSDNVNPFRYLFGSRKSQYLVTAAELSALGMTAGPITSFGLDVVNAVNTHNGFRIAMKNTTTTALTTAAWEGGLTQVYGPAAFTAIAGINNFAVTGFSWDGTSNLLIQFCWGNNNTGGSSSTTVRYDNTTYSTHKAVYWDNMNANNICSNASVDITSNARPKFIFGFNSLCEGTRTMITATIKPLDTWIGINSNWNDVQNWCPGVPTAASNVTIPVVSSNIYPILTIGQTANCNNLTIVAGATSISIDPGAVLDIRGSLQNDGVLTNNGTIRLTGSAASAQVFPGPGTIAAMKILQIDNTGGGVAINRSFAIDSLLRPTSGLFNLGNFDITLRSTNAVTASVTPVTGSISYGTGRFVVERYIKNTGNWNLIAAPIADAQNIFSTWQEGGANTANYGTRITGPTGNPGGPVNAAGLDQYSIGYSMKWWDGNNALFRMKTNTASTAADSLVNKHTGYFLFARGDRTIGTGATGAATTLRSRGRLFVGTSGGGGVTPASITYNALAAGDFISVANPYASAIDPTLLTTTGLNAAYYVWDPTMNGNFTVGQYRAFSATGAWLTTPTPSAPSAYPAAPYKAIQSGQAFMMQANATNATVGFEEADKITGTLTFSRGPEDIVLMSTMLHSTNNYVLDGNRVAYDDLHSNTVGDEDAGKIINNGENFGILNNGRQLIIEGKKPIIATDTIFYQMSNLRTQAYKLSFEPRNLGNTGLIAELIDTYLNSRTPVSLSDSSWYHFTATSDAASKAANRFMLVFRSPGGPVPVTFVSIAAQRQSDRSIKVNWEVANEVNIEQYEVQRSADATNFTGILTADATNSRSYTKNDLSPLAADNYYRIKAIGVSGDITYSSIVKVAPDKQAGSIAVQPNPVKDKQLNIRFTNMPEGSYLLQLNNTLGQRVYSGMVAISNAAQVKNITLPSTTAAGVYHLLVLDKGNVVAGSERIVVE